MDLSLTTSETTSTRMETSTTTPDYVSERIINEIKKRIKEAKEKLNGHQDMDVIEITLPPINSKHYLSILEDIHSVLYHVERIGEKLFIKFNSGAKAAVHVELMNDLKNQLPNNWWVQINVTSVVNSSEYLPDVGAWQRRPTHNQRNFPIIFSSPPPLIWIEVVYNQTKDRERAMTNIHLVKPHCARTEFLIVVLGKTPHPNNPNPRATSVPVGAPLNIHPHQSPYIGYWPSHVNYNAVRWYKINWNQHLSIGYNVHIDFNVILNQLTDDEEDDEEDNSEDKTIVKKMKKTIITKKMKKDS